MTRRTAKVVVRLVALSLVMAGVAVAGPLRREMTVREGPEKVFSKPVSEVEPVLKGATRTGRNGRVGNEFVFWGYLLANGKPAFFYACLPANGVDCLERRALICDHSLTVVNESGSSGAVQKLSCVPVCQPSQSAQPCCTGAEEQLPLVTGVVSCN